ncbi:MAG: DUF4349 domain-containing protein [Oscillospiraceae bacterium]|nr:DUF4349 domain-containing protein [Oscillospiraceae bacterium]
MKKMKLLAFSLALILFLAACSGGMNFAASDEAAPLPETAEFWSADEPEIVAFADFSGFGSGLSNSDGFSRQTTLQTGRAASESEPAVPSAEDAASGDTATPVTATISVDRIIFEANATIQTEDFDDTIRQVYTLTERYQGFIQWSNISGGDAPAARGDGRVPGRSAEFSIRIPARSYGAMTEALDSLGHVSHLGTSATNVSGQYADITSRLHSLRVQEERILAMLERATTLSEMLDLEARLGDLIFQIEQFTSQRNDLDQRISYSTVHLHISEVEEIIPEPEPDEPDATTVGGAFASSLQALRAFGRGIVLVLATLAPWLIVIAVVGVPVLMVVFGVRKRKKGE